MPQDYDAIVLGAGAAGLMAALTAAERGRRVLLLEKGRNAGVKILMSGGTRCNITHDCDVRGIIEAFGPNGKFLHSALAKFTPADAVAFFNGEGVATKIESTGKVFPVSDRALDVRDALVRRLERSGAMLSLGEPALELEAAEGGFRIGTPMRSITAERVLITTGGLSFPGCGTTGDGYGFAAKFGHSIAPTRPALVPLNSEAAWVRELKGITLESVGLKVIDSTGKVLDKRRGAMLFAHFGLTGPAPLDVSRAVSGHPEPKSLTLDCDLLPDEPEAKFDQWLQAVTMANGKKLLAGIVAEVMQRRVADAVMAQAGLSVDRTAAALSKPDRAKLVAAVKRLRIPLAGTLGYGKAEVTAGGVNLNEVDSRTMESKLKKGLFLAGEVLDLDGWIGGYNFQGAWSTGHLAGMNL